MILIQQNRTISQISTVTYFEMLHGILILPDGKRKERLMAYLEETVVPFYSFLSYDFEAAKMNAQIIAKLEPADRKTALSSSHIAELITTNSPYSARQSWSSLSRRRAAAKIL